MIDWDKPSPSPAAPSDHGPGVAAVTINTLILLTQMMQIKNVHVRFYPKAPQVFPKGSLCLRGKNHCISPTRGSAETGLNICKNHVFRSCISSHLLLYMN